MELTAEKRQTAQIDRIFKLQQKRSVILRQEAVSVRKDRLRRLSAWLFANRERVKQAVHQDFNKPLLEVDTTEIYPIIAEIRHVLSHLDEWAKPTKIDATLSYLGTRSEIRYEPKGVCLIIAPWNFPFNLCIGPLISCLAAGNTAILKPSELTPATSKLVSEMIPEIFIEDEVAVIEGGIDIASHLISLPFDHIFFTGSPAVGKVVMKAAAENLTSVTLELGGKSPTIIDGTARIKDAARRIAFGKFMNNGQTCIAPDYVLVEEKIRDEFLKELKHEVITLFGENDTLTESSPSYARIVNSKNFQRINHLVQDAVQRGAKLDVSGPVNEKTRFIHPIVLSDVPLDSAIMENEIFGPVLPVITYSKPEEITSLINSKPKPLALYIFSNNKSFREQILNQTSAGGVCINDCIIQFTHPNLPFGGVNNSGIGKSHGRYGFLAFSNEKPILKQKNGFASPYMLYPPYLPKMKKIVDLLLRWF
jgi:aldehyde dehydrogenase (NAD+)